MLIVADPLFGLLDLYKSVERNSFLAGLACEQEKIWCSKSVPARWIQVPIQDRLQFLWTESGNKRSQDTQLWHFQMVLGSVLLEDLSIGF